MMGLYYQRLVDDLALKSMVCWLKPHWCQLMLLRSPEKDSVREIFVPHLMNRISKIRLFRKSRELQFGICNQGEPHVSPHSTGKGPCFYREEKEGERLSRAKSP